MVHSSVIPTTQLAYQKGLSTCVALLCISHTLQSALNRGHEARIEQIDFSAACAKVDHKDIHISSALWVLEVLGCRD